MLTTIWRGCGFCAGFLEVFCAASWAICCSATTSSFCVWLADVWTGLDDCSWAAWLTTGCCALIELFWKCRITDCRTSAATYRAPADKSATTTELFTGIATSRRMLFLRFLVRQEKVHYCGQSLSY